MLAITLKLKNATMGTFRLLCWKATSRHYQNSIPLLKHCLNFFEWEKNIKEPTSVVDNEVEVVESIFYTEQSCRQKLKYNNINVEINWNDGDSGTICT